MQRKEAEQLVVEAEQQRAQARFWRVSVMEIHIGKSLEIQWQLPSGKRTHNYGKPPFLMFNGKLTVGP